MNTEQWEAHIQGLLDQVCQPPPPPPQTTADEYANSQPKSSNAKPSSACSSRRQPNWRHTPHPQRITSRSCKNQNCTADDSDFIVDANGGSVVCIACGMIQTIGVLEDAHTFADSVEGATSSVHAVHRYSRIAYVRGLLTSTEGETNVELTLAEIRAISHYITNHAKYRDCRRAGNERQLAQEIKKAVNKMQLRPCLVYHAQTIAFKMFGVDIMPPRNETEIRTVLHRFRALENEWDRAPRNGPLRKGAKKFPSIPWMWRRICIDLGLDESKDLLYVVKSQKRCLSKRETQYQKLTALVLGSSVERRVS